MEKFKFSGYSPSWPGWFDDLVDQDKVLITTDTDPTYENDDNWQEDWIYVAYLWTPNKITVAYEGKTIVNHGTYCGLEQHRMVAKRLAKDKVEKKERKNQVDELLMRFGRK